MDVYEKLKELGVTLPPPAPPAGIYKPVRVHAGAAYVSGQSATVDGVPQVTGKVGGLRSVEEGQQAARLCALNALAVLHNDLGDLNKVRGVIKVLGFVQSAPGFDMQPKVINGASQLLKDIWGEDGVGARSAIGVNELPGNVSVEIEFVFEL